jgi:ketosteroid isomerase-like protein
MKLNAAISLALVFGAVAMPSCVSASPGGNAAIEALESRFAAAFNAKDVDGIMKCYVPDQSLFVFDAVPPRQYVGADAYRKDWKDFLATFKGPLKFEASDLDVGVEGPIGYSHSIQHVTGTDTKNKPVDFTVRVTDVYRKIGTKWLIVQEHVSVPVDFNTGKPDMNSAP